MKPLRQQLIREWQLLLTDSWLLSLTSWVPVMLFFIIWWIFSAGLPRELAIGVVDLDHSKSSRTLIRQFNSHPSIRVSHQYIDSSAGSTALRSTEIIALVIIPSKFEKNIINSKSPQVTAFYNSQFLLTGNLVANSLRQAQGSFGNTLDLRTARYDGKVGAQALGAAVPVGSQITPLFNVNTNYAYFLASGVIPGIWQIIIVMITMLSLSREIRLNGLAAWLGDQPIAAIAGKLLPYTVILWLQGVVFLMFMYGLLHWTMNGSWAILLLGQLLMVVASQAMGLLLFLLVKDPARALSMAAAYTAPSFAFMGVTFPASSMTTIAQLWRNILPVSHYIEIQLFQTNHGASIFSALPHMGALLLFFIAFPLAYKLATNIQCKAQTA
ncbi:MAG: ABC transporter permease [Gammaproteobacteria bacterium]